MKIGCLKYANLKFKNHLIYLKNRISKKTNNTIDKIKKIITNENVLITIFIIFSISFFILMLILALK